MEERLFVDPQAAERAALTASAGKTELLTVPHALRGAVRSMLYYEERFEPGQTAVERVVPEASIRLVFNFGNPATLAFPRQPGDVVQVIGAWARPALVVLGGRMEGISLSLRPSATRRLLGVSASEIAGRVLHLDELWGGTGLGLWRSLVAVTDRGARIRLIERALSVDHGDATSAAHVMDHAAQLIEESAGKQSIADVAQTVGVGERRLQQLFREHVGITPRTYRRIARLRHCVRTLQGRSGANWAEFAQEAGFFDQAHLSNEFRDLTGLTPQRYLELPIAGSSKTGGRGGDTSAA